jgi:hypothetical protein
MTLNRKLEIEAEIIAKKMSHGGVKDTVSLVLSILARGAEIALSYLSLNQKEGGEKLTSNQSILTPEDSSDSFCGCDPDKNWVNPECKIHNDLR